MGGRDRGVVGITLPASIPASIPASPEYDLTSLLQLQTQSQSTDIRLTRTVGPNIFVCGSSFSLILLFSVVFALDDAHHSSLLPFYSTRDGLASTSHLVDWVDWVLSNDGYVHAPSLSIGAVASLLTPQSLIGPYNTTDGLQKQGMRA